MRVFDYVKKYQLVSKQHSEEIVSFLNSIEVWQPHTWYNNYNDNYNYEKDFEYFYDKSFGEKFQPRILDILDKYSTDVMGKWKPPSFINTLLKVHKYTTKGIDEHVDHIHDLFNERPKGIPILSLVGCFNDDYVGGNFYLCDKMIHINAGECIVFPSVFLYPHYVTPIESGVRYSWVSWAC